MNEPEPHLDIVKIQELVIDERYREAFEALPNAVRTLAITVAQQVRAAMGDIFNTDRDRYKEEIIDALAAHNIQQAATLLAAHPDNAQVAQPTAESKPEKRPALKKPELRHALPKTGVPYFPMADEERNIRGVEGKMIFPAACERLAQEVFSETNPRLTAWLFHMEHDLQVPSSPGMFDILVREKVMRMKKVAEGKLQSRPPQPLNYAQSNAYHHTERYITELKAQAQQRLQNKTFSHLVEYVVVELLDHLKDRMDPKLRRVLKSSPEEDLFRGSDFVVEDEDGRFWSVDLTVAQHEEILDEKRTRNQYRQHVSLPNLQAMLIAKDEIEPHENLSVVPIVQQVDRDLVRMVTQEYMNSIKSGANKPLTQIFREVAARLGKNDDQASRGLLDLAA